MIQLTTTEQVTWLNKHRYIVSWKELPFSFEEGEDRGWIESRVVTKMKEVPTVKGLLVCDDYERYMKNFDSFFNEKFKEYILNL